MRFNMKGLRSSLVFGIAAILAFPALACAQTTILQATDAGKILPDAVFFGGQSANTQVRNSGGIHFADGAYTLAVLVDTSGYSTAVQQKYQGYLLTEAPLDFSGNRLPAGAYGFGFVDNHFLVMDIGAHNLFETMSTHDSQMPRPVPLRILEAASPGHWRLCSGRDCVNFARAR